MNHNSIYPILRIPAIVLGSICYALSGMALAKGIDYGFFILAILGGIFIILYGEATSRSESIKIDGANRMNELTISQCPHGIYTITLCNPSSGACINLTSSRHCGQWKIVKRWTLTDDEKAFTAKILSAR